jgi:hypothetical protein
MRSISPVFFLGILLLFPACSGDKAASSDTNASVDLPNTPTFTYTYHKDVRPLIETHCLGCHAEGGIGPFGFPDYESVRSMDTLVSSAVTGKKMPPWQPTLDCVPLADTRVIPEADIKIIETWVQEGSPEGDEADYPEPETETTDELGEADLLIDAGAAYTADTSRPDDWRCLPLQHTFEKETFVEVVDVIPDQKAIVHHVLLYLIPEGAIEQMEQMDADEEGPGYTCFGGPGVGSGDTLGGWVPGSVRSKRSEQPTALRIPAGSRVVMQVHYNVLGLAEDEVPQPDRSQVAMWMMEEGEAPDFLLEIVPFPHFGIQIPPNESNHSESKDFILPTDTLVVGVTPHMHAIGKSIRVDYIQQEEEHCIVDIPEWDFNWQQFYRFEQDSVLEMKAGDVIRLSCTYDNSAENQAVVNGVQQDPKTVEWGDSTLDEMCLTYLMFMKPYGEVVEQCAGVASCINSCETGDHLCFAGCLLGSGNDCAFCVVPSVLACGATFCPTEGGALLSCTQNCESADESCLFQECGSEFATYYSCFEPYMKAGECDLQLGDCGVNFADLQEAPASEE